MLPQRAWRESRTNGARTTLNLSIGGAVATYEITLGPAARWAIRSLQSEKARAGLADALRQELDHGPNVRQEYRFEAQVEGETKTYTATPLSVGYTAVHRPMTAAELRKLRQKQGPAGNRGFYVADILEPESGFKPRH